VHAVQVDANEAGYHPDAKISLGNFEVNWKQLDPHGPFLLIAGDDSIAYKFGSFAEARFPITLWQFSGDRFADVTTHYPEYIIKDSASHQADWLKTSNPNAVVAEVADLLLLHRKTDASNAFAALQGNVMAPAMRQWLISEGYGDPVDATIVKSNVTAPEAIATQTTEQNATSETPQQQSEPQVAQPPAEYAPPATTTTNCESVSITDVFDDGAVLDLDDGRHLRVSDADTVTSSVWVAPFDALICNGDRLINKDDNEAVDLVP
jgi:hypothetical protein